MSRTLNRIFYIYTEANAAVMMAIIALIQVACYFASPLFFKPFCLAFAAIAVAITIHLVWYIYRTEKQYK